MTDSVILFWSGIALIMALSLVVGLIRRSNSVGDWLSAGHNQGILPIAGSVVGTMIGGALFVAIVSFGYENGIVGFYLAIAYFVGLILLGLCAPRIRALLNESGSETLFDLLRKRISVRFGRAFEGVNALLLVMAIGGQVLALEEYLSIPSLDLAGDWIFYLASALILITTSIYVIFGGLRKDIFSDVLQLVFMAIGIGFLLKLVSGAPVASTIGGLDAELWQVGAKTPIFLGGILLLFVPALLVRVDLWQRIRAARSDSAASWAFYVSAPVVAGSFVLFTLLGMLARGSGLAGEGAVLSSLIQFSAPGASGELYVALVAVAFVGAIISTLDSLINIAGVAITRLGYRSVVGGESAALSIKKLRWGSLIAVVLGVGIAMVVRDIVELFLAAVSFVMVAAPAVVLLILRDRASARGAFVSLAVGLVILLSLVWILPATAFIPAAVVGWLIYFGIAWYERRANRKRVTNGR